jgi:Putative zinc-finger
LSGVGSQGPCPEWEERLSALVDGDLGAEDQQLVETHLHQCTGCQRGFAELKVLCSSLRDLGPLEPPPELFESVATAVGRRRRRIALGATAGVAAAGLLALVVSLSLSRPPAPSVAPRVVAPVTLRERAQSELKKAVKHYQAAVGMLRKLADVDKPLWPAARRRAYEADISMLDRSLEETRLLVRRAPTDPALQEMLFASYRTQIDYLRDVLTPPEDDDSI